MGLVRTLLAGVIMTTSVTAVLGAATTIEYLRTVARTLPDHRVVLKWQPEEGTRILGADGSLLSVHARQRREFVELAAIPKIVVEAFLAAEDSGYWSHSGIDPTAIARAMLSNLKAGHSTQGGSTITQQVVKNLITGDERSLSRKVREALLAMRLDRDVGKEKVLEVYLNEIYLGSGSYGVAAAARTYFGKGLSDLSPAEAALLAGMPKAPGTSDPYRNPTRALERRNYVIGRMAEEGLITPTAAAAAMASSLGVQPRRNEASEPHPAIRYPEEEVRRRLVRQVGSDAVYGKGVTVRTTIRPDTQRAVHAALRRGLVAEDRRGGWRGPLARGIPYPVDWSSSRLEKPAGAEDWQVAVVVDSGRDAVVLLREGGRIVLPGRSMAWATAASRSDAILRRGDAVLVGDLGHGPELVQIPEAQGAAALLDPVSGDVLALDGGFSYETSEFNRATQAKRQTGSVFKTFVYLAALEMGYDATSPVLDAPIAIEQGPGRADWRPQNSSGTGSGLITLRRSLEQSRNMSTVRLLHDIGPDPVRSVAHRVGFELPGRFSYAMALGASEATPLEVAAGYAAIANGGRRIVPRFFVEESSASPAARSVDEVAAAQVTSILRGVVSNGTAKRAFAGFGRPVAAKTGTTNDQRDAWLVAFGPRFVLSVWIGRDDHGPLRSGASGGATAAPVARDILDTAPGIDFAEFTLPDQADEVSVRRETGQRSERGDVIEIMRPAPAHP